MNRKTNFAMSAILASATLLSATQMSARIIDQDKKWEEKNSCFITKRIPAVVRTNTKGILVQDEQTSWKGDTERNNSHVVLHKSPAVYITTEEEIEAQHVTLIPKPCR